MRQPRTTHPTCRGPGPTRCTPSTPRQATAKPSHSGHISAAGLLGLDKAVHPTPIPSVDCLVPFELARKHRGPAVDLTFLQPPRLRVPVLQLQLEEERVPQGGGGREVPRPSVGEGRQPPHAVAHRQPLAPRLVLPGVRDAQVRCAPVHDPPSTATSFVSRSVALPNALRQSRHVHTSSVRWSPRRKSALPSYDRISIIPSRCPLEGSFIHVIAADPIERLLCSPAADPIEERRRQLGRVGILREASVVNLRAMPSW